MQLKNGKHISFFFLVSSCFENLFAGLKSFYYHLLWRRDNSENLTQLGYIYSYNNISVGKYSYGKLNVFSNQGTSKLIIHNFVAIGPDVDFILQEEHPLSNISIFPFKENALNIDRPEALSKGDIIIDDDVWIGQRATILSGVHIHQGAVVAAGAVVTHDVSPYAIVGGVPAKVIKYRFSPEIIAQLLKLDYSKLTDDMIRERIDDLYTSLDGKSPEEVEKLLAWFPKKQ